VWAIVWAIVTCDNFLYGFKGAPPARQADQPGVSSEGRARAIEGEK
jgi:hypothetical protein